MKFIIYTADVTGVQDNCTYPHRHEIVDVASLAKAVRRDHVCAKYKNCYRGKDNFIVSNCVVMDVDNDHTEDPAGWITPEALVESAMQHIRILEELDFHDMKISLKAHDVPLTLAAYRLMSETVDYPLHLGITEAGTVNTGIIKSAVGIGALLAEGIGDTFRISLTGDPVVEVKVANEILKSLGLKEYGPTLVACPTCGRTSIDLPAIAAQVEKKLETIKDPIDVAVMGCVVNGPGEARGADVGIAGGNGEGLIFRKGEIIRKVPEEILVEELFKEIDAILEERKQK